MKKRISFLLTLIAVAAVTTITTVSCNKKFDSPVLIGSNVTGNTTIKQLKSLDIVGGGATIPINENSIAGIDSIVIVGYVSADDKSGNIYKQLYIQDSTGGIAVKLNGTNLYTSYPIGTQISIKCTGLALSDYNGSMELGALDNSNPSTPALAGIPNALFFQYIKTGTLKNVVKPTIVTLNQLKAVAKLKPYQDTLQNTLIQIVDAEFAASDTGATYANTALGINEQRNLTSCSGGTTIVYNSSFAGFANLILPSGSGSLNAIYTPYNGTSELILRDTSDVQLNGPRCGSVVTPPPTTLPSGLVSITTLRSAFGGNGIKANSSQQITGVVISDETNKDINKSTVIIQQGTSGISVYFGSSVTVAYNVGDSIVVDISGDSVISYPYTGGSLEIKGTSTQYNGITKVSSGNTVTPQVLTIAQLNTKLSLPLNDPGNNEYTLVQIANATVSPAGPYYTKSVYPELKDGGSAYIELFTVSSATFASTTMPTTAKTWIGYGNSYGGYPEFQIRNLSDVQ